MRRERFLILAGLLFRILRGPVGLQFLYHKLAVDFGGYLILILINYLSGSVGVDQVIRMIVPVQKP